MSFDAESSVPPVAPVVPVLPVSAGVGVAVAVAAGAAAPPSAVGVGVGVASASASASALASSERSGRPLLVRHGQLDRRARDLLDLGAARAAARRGERKHEYGEKEGGTEQAHDGRGRVSAGARPYGGRTWGSR